MIDDISWHKVPALRASRLIKTVANHALTGAAITGRPFVPKLKNHSLCDNPKFSRQQFLQSFLQRMMY